MKPSMLKKMKKPGDEKPEMDLSELDLSESSESAPEGEAPMGEEMPPEGEMAAPNPALEKASDEEIMAEAKKRGLMGELEPDGDESSDKVSLPPEY